MILDNGAEVIIGLEVHVELKTATKLFCSCPSTFGAPPNTVVCPVCLGYPGVLPRLNGEAVRLATRAALALGCRINLRSKFDRKNYFYPDLPKGYQISQYDEPLAEWGAVALDLEGRRTVRIRRIHIEEEAGKLTHQGDSLWGADRSFVDFNRAGIPLIEIVSEPDLRSPEEARRYLHALIRTLSYVDVSDLKMQEGSLRCDANISLRPPGFTGPLEQLPRVEIKNINSVRNVVRGLEYEVERQGALLDAGAAIDRETRGFDDASGRTVSQRSKEAANDYRYFPEPDLPPVELDPAWVETERAALPLLPLEWAARLRQWGIREQDVEVLVGQPDTVRYLEAAVGAGADPGQVAQWMLGDLSRLLNADRRGFGDAPVSPAQLAGLLALLAEGRLSGRLAKEVLDAMYATGRDAASIVQERGLAVLADEAALQAMVDQVVREHPQVVRDFLSGKERALGFLVGQIMKATRGQAKPDLVGRLLKDRLAQERVSP